MEEKKLENNFSTKLGRILGAIFAATLQICTSALIIALTIKVIRWLLF